MVKIGVLALQGSVIEHTEMLNSIDGVEALEVRTCEDIATLSGIVLPGGESTTISKLLNDFEIMETLKQRIKEGMPVWGTCAGMILLAKTIIGEENSHLGLMDITVRRNAYGGQLDSFKTLISIPEVSNEEIPLVFIRAPWVESVEDSVNILASIDDRIIAVEQDNMLATSFHPELTSNLSFHKYFANKVKNSK